MLPEGELWLGSAYKLPVVGPADDEFTFVANGENQTAAEPAGGTVDRERQLAVELDEFVRPVFGAQDTLEDMRLQHGWSSGTRSNR